MSDERPSAIITGAASGLGRAIAVRLARDGWRMALADVNEAGLRATLEQVRAAGGEGRVELLDVTQADHWQALRKRLQSDWRQLDLLVNNAGVAGSGEVGQFSLDNWHWLLDVNLFGTIYGCHTFVEWLKANPRGAHLVNTASLAGLLSAPTMAAYNVSKAGVVSLSETLYGELKQHGVGVTVVCPGFFRTELLASGRFQKEDERGVAERSMEAAPFTADDVADAAVRSIQQKQLYVVMGSKGRRWWRIKRWLPAFFARALAKRFAGGLPESL
jgi:NADP-dependent 3-hydroxy acid dehydrogenase YdfG